jgi:hypothetical protein
MKLFRWSLVTGLASTSLFVATVVSMGSFGCSSSSGTPSGGAGGGGGAGGAAGAGGGGGGSSAQPTITISSPANGATVAATAGTHKTVPISFTVTNFTLMPAGSCAGAAGCGHIHEFTDGTTCAPAGQGYNNQFAASPGNVWLDLCPTVDASHTTKLELHNDDHSLYTCGGSCPNGITQQVQYTATGP